MSRDAGALADSAQLSSSTTPHQPTVGPPRGSLGVASLLGVLGVVYGDIGTSPLYALKATMAIISTQAPTPWEIVGIESLIFWSLILVVTIKYVTLIMRADNDGEGGILALMALAQRVAVSNRMRGLLGLVGIIGACLFFGDGTITPAISVLSAVEGLEVSLPSAREVVLPIAIIVIVALFTLQWRGTGSVGRIFGPIMVLWFGTIGALGAIEVARDPFILTALLPHHAAIFMWHHGWIAFVALGAVVLSVTGAEALYADMGHFGRAPIRFAWLFFVLPSLALNYLGQGALIISHPAAIKNPFFLLGPDWLRLPMVVLATAATVIASQAVISGAFSLSRQGMQLGLLPPLSVRQTSESEGGQIYLPGVNAILFVGVLVVMLAFRSSERLATAYGVSVTGALVVDTLLLLLVARVLWHWRPWQVALAAVAFGGVEVTFLSANLSKIAHGGWLPLLIAVIVFTVMTTWQRGRQIVTANRRAKEGSLREFVEDARDRGLVRVPGTAVFPHPGKETTPLALRANVEHNHVLHQGVIIMSAAAENVPHIPAEERVTSDDLGYNDDGIQHLSVRFGFSDKPDLPGALRQACVDGLLEPSVVDVGDASFFLSRGSIKRTPAPGMRRWRKMLFVALAHNAADPAAYFGLPPDRTVTMGSDVNV